METGPCIQIFGCVVNIYTFSIYIFQRKKEKKGKRKKRNRNRKINPPKSDVFGWQIDLNVYRMSVSILLQFQKRFYNTSSFLGLLIVTLLERFSDIKTDTDGRK